MATAYRTFVVRQRELDQLLHSQNGTVGQHFQTTAAAVTRMAKQVAGEKLQRHTGESGYHAGFRSQVDHGPRLRVWNSSKIASYIENGTRPHLIRPRRAGGVLRFTARGGGVVFARVVHHPGTKPYRILETALSRVVKRDRR